MNILKNLRHPDLSHILKDLPDSEVDIQILEQVGQKDQVPYDTVFRILIKSVRQLRREMNRLHSKDGVRSLLKDLEFDEKMEVADSLLTDLKSTVDN